MFSFKTNLEFPISTDMIKFTAHTKQRQSFPPAIYNSCT